MSEPIRAEMVTRKGRPIDSYGQGRTCKRDECTTRLSQYNPEQFCYTHTPRRQWNPHSSPTGTRRSR